MKKNICLPFLFVIFFLSSFSFAQPTDKMNYQAIARNAGGNILSNQLLGIRITIEDGSGGAILYQERQTPTTNQFGLFTLQIGGGTVLSGSYGTINWGAGNEWLKVEMDPNGGTTYTNMGESQLLSVPFANYATASENSVTTTAVSGTPNYVSKFTGTSSEGNSQIFDNGTNVGIGTTAPDARLEVNGQVKITGGTPGIDKVLTSDANGLGSWQAAGGGCFTHSQLFTAAGNFTVPQGVTSIKVMMWGGGSGGRTISVGFTRNGGSSGAYAEGIFDEVPGTVCTIAVGAGGAQNGFGGSSTFNDGSHSMVANGNGSDANGGYLNIRGAIGGQGAFDYYKPVAGYGANGGGIGGCTCYSRDVLGFFYDCQGGGGGAGLGGGYGADNDNIDAGSASSGTGGGGGGGGHVCPTCGNGGSGSVIVFW